MRKIQEVPRLRHERHLAQSAIAASCGISRCTGQDTLKRFATARLTWPMPGDLDETALDERLYPPVRLTLDVPRPDLATAQSELAEKGVTRPLLWQEYKAQHLDGLEYSAFCQRYAA